MVKAIQLSPANAMAPGKDSNAFIYKRMQLLDDKCKHFFSRPTKLI